MTLLLASPSAVVMWRKTYASGGDGGSSGGDDGDCGSADDCAGAGGPGKKEKTLTSKMDVSLNKAAKS